jgi:hypothetical protein
MKHRKKKTPNIAVDVLAFLISVREVPCSKFGSTTGYLKGTPPSTAPVKFSDGSSSIATNVSLKTREFFRERTTGVKFHENPSCGRRIIQFEQTDEKRKTDRETSF